MHWATPKTDRMIKNKTTNGNQTPGSSNPFRKSERLPLQTPFNKDYDPLCVQSHQCVDSQPHGKNENKFPHEYDFDSNFHTEIEINEEKENIIKDNISIGDNEEDDGVTYSPTPYDKIPFRVGTPPPEWQTDGKVAKNNQQSPKTSHGLDSKMDTAQSR